MLTLLRMETNFSAPVDGAGGLPLPAFARSVCRLATGRSALFHLIARLPTPHARTVLMPCYIAEGVIGPFRAADFNVRFYRLNADLTPNEADVAAILDETLGRAVFMLIHYFGFSSASKALLDMLHDHRAIVVSDCAHALLSTTEDGISLAELGDVALYSLNKFLPIADGAILLSLANDIDIAIAEERLPELPKPALAHFKRHLAECRELFMCSSASGAAKMIDALSDSYEAYYALINTDLRPYRQSDESRWIEAAYSFQNCAKVRWSHALRLYGELSSPAFNFVHATLPEGTVPFGIPARVPRQRRAELLETLSDRGILLSTLVDKWDFVPQESVGHFSVETDFLAEHVLIPVSEFLSEADMSRIITEINNIH